MNNIIEKYIFICNKCCLIELRPLLKKMNINVIETRDIEYNNVLIIIFASDYEINELRQNGYFFHTNEKEAFKNLDNSICSDYICNICVIE